jgi:glycosyltransferase involved in cell wall biosynthesis
MKILFLAPYLPSPPRSGGPRRVHGLMSELARAYEVSILALSGIAEDQGALAATRAYCAEVVTVPDARASLGTAAKRQLQLRSLLSPRSFEYQVYRRPAVQAALDALLARRDYDVVNIEFSLMAQYRFPRGPRRRPRIVLDEHNIEYDILRRTSAAEGGLVRRLYNYLDFQKLRGEERGAWRRIDGCTLTSARDEAILREQAPALPTKVVPNGVDLEHFRPGPAGAVDQQLIVFFGAISYYPNTDGLLYFLREVFPLLQVHYPALRLRIVGPEPPEAIRCWASDRIEVTGFVDDVRPHIEQAAAIIAPLRIGGGTRLKIVEAMAMGKAIVSTRIGAEGLAVTDGENLLLADEAPAFAAQVGRVLDDPALRERLGLAARELVERHYGWRAAAAKLERFYRQLLNAAPQGAVTGHTVAAMPQTRADS